MTMTKKVTIHDVAERAGVSISSVSRALSDHPHVSSGMRARVEAAVEALNYQPDFIGHSLRRGKTNSVGFLVGNLSNPVIADISDGAAKILNAYHYAMSLVCTQNDPKQDEAYLQFLRRRQVDGLLISSSANAPDLATPLVEQLGLPTVMLDRARPIVSHISAVQSDHAQGMQAAVTHLLHQGHRRIALIGGHKTFYPAQQRLAGFKAAFNEAGLAIDPRYVHSLGMETEKAYAITRDIFSAPQPPTALIAGGNTILVGILQALQTKQIQVGHDIALIGCDDTALAQLYTPSITVIARDLHLLGETAANLLIDTMEKGKSKRVVLPTRLLIRESSIVSIT